ncbi:hypothetical protein ACHAWX_007290 [Stephanocyclus meneghinianus]
MKNNKRIASSSSPLSGSWVIIAVLVLRVRDVRTWTTLPPSISLSWRHVPQQTSSVTYLRSIEKPSGTQVVSKLTGRKNVGSSSLPMVMDADADSQQQEEFNENDKMAGDDDQTDEDSIMEIANALTSSKPPALNKSNELEIDQNEVESYLNKAAVAWGGATASAKTDVFNKPKINKTRLVGLTARETFLSGGFKTLKGSIPKSYTGRLNDIGAGFKAPSVKGTPFASLKAESQPEKSKVDPVIGSLGPKPKTDFSTQLKGSVPKQFTPLDKKSYGNTFLSSLKAQNDAVRIGEVPQFKGSLFKSMKSPGFGEKQKTDTDGSAISGGASSSSSSSSSSGPKIGVGFPSGSKSSFNGSVAITNQTTGKISSDSQRVISSKADASTELSQLEKESNGNPIVSFLKIPKGAVGLGDKKQVVGSVFKSIKSPGIVGKEKLVDGVNESSDSYSKVGVAFPSGLKTPLKTLNPKIKRSSDIVKDADEESPPSMKRFIKPNDNVEPIEGSELNDGISKTSITQSSGNNYERSIAATVAIDFNEESKALEEKEKWISEQNQLVEERRRKRLAMPNVDIDRTKVAIDFDEESKLLEEKEKWVIEQNQMIEDRRAKRLQKFGVESIDKGAEQVAQIDSENITLRGDNLLRIRDKSSGNTIMPSPKVPKGADGAGEKNQLTGTFLKSTQAPGIEGSQKAVDSTVSNFSNIGIGLSSSLNTPLKQSISAEQLIGVSKVGDDNFRDSTVDIENSEKPDASDRGEGQLLSAPLFVLNMSKNASRSDLVPAEDEDDSNDGDDKSSDTVGGVSSSVRVNDAVAGDALDFIKESKLLEEQERWIEEQNQLVEKRRLQRLHASEIGIQEKGVEHTAYQPKPYADEEKDDSREHAIGSNDETAKKKDADPNHDDEMSSVADLSISTSSPATEPTGMVNTESYVKGANPPPPTKIKGTIKSFGIDSSKSKLGVASSSPLKGFVAKKVGISFSPTIKGTLKAPNTGVIPPVILKGPSSKDSRPQQDSLASPAKAVGITPHVVPEGLSTKESTVKDSNPAFPTVPKETIKSSGADPSKSKLGVVSSVPMTGFVAKKAGLPFSPTMKGAITSFNPSVPLRGAASKESVPEGDDLSSPAKAVGIASPVVINSVATTEFPVKGASPSPPTGIKGTVKSFGIDSSKSKLGVASSSPLKGFVAKTVGLPFSKATAGTFKSFDTDVAPPVPFQGDASKESYAKEESSFVDPVMSDINVLHSEVSKSGDDDFAKSLIALDSKDSEDTRSPLIDAPDGSVRKEIGTGAPFEPKAFSPPKTRTDKQTGIIDVAFESTDEDAWGFSEYDNTAMGNEVKDTKQRPSIQPSRPLNLWSGESFKGTVSSRSYGLGFNRPLASSESMSSGVEPNQTSRVKQRRDEVENTIELNTERTEDSISHTLKREDTNVTAGDLTHTIPEKDLKIKLLEESNRLLKEKLKLKILETSKAEEDKRKAEQRLYSEQIGLLANHIVRLEKQVASAAAKAERAVRSREDEIKTMAEIIERKTSSQSVLEARTETLLREINNLQSSTEKQNRKDMENLKNALLESVKLELSKLKSLHSKELDSIASQLKVEEEKRKEMLKINQSQSKQLSDLKTQLIVLQQNDSLSKAKQVERENEVALNNKINVEEVMENIKSIPSLHNVILAGDDVSDKQGSTKINADSPTNSLPKYETLSQDARIPTAGGDKKSSQATKEVPSNSSGDEISEAASDSHTVHHSISDALAADVEALELISFCHADFDPESPSGVHPNYDPIRTLQECAIPSNYPFVSILRDSSPYIVNHRHSTIVYHIPGELISDSQKFFSVMDDIALTWLFGMKIVIAVGCRSQIVQRLEKLHGASDAVKMPGVRVTTPETLRILEEEAGFCRFEVERLLNRCLRNKGADCNVVSGCFITANKFGVVDGIDYQLTGYPVNLQVDKIHRLHSRNDVILLTPLGFTKDGDALNVHSEALAAFTAGELKASKVVYFSSHPMVLRGTRNRNSGNERIQMIQRSNANEILSHYGLHVNSVTGFPSWKSNYDVRGNKARNLSYHQQSMLLKMGWATHAIEKGVERAHIIDCEDGSLLDELFTARRGYGTCISQDNYEAPHPEDWNDDLSVADGVDTSMMEW